MKDQDFDNLFSDAFGEHETPVPKDMWQRVQAGKDEAFDNLFADALTNHESPVPEDMWHRINNPGDVAFDNAFATAFTNHEIPVPANMWNRVNPNKDDEGDKAIAWRRWFMAAALILFLGGAAWWYSQNSVEQHANGKNNSEGKSRDKIITTGDAQKANENALNGAAIDSGTTAAPGGATTVDVNTVSGESAAAKNNTKKQSTQSTGILSATAFSNLKNSTDQDKKAGTQLTTQDRKNTAVVNQPNTQAATTDVAKNNDSAGIIAQQNKNTMAVDSNKTPTPNAVAAIKKQPAKTSKWSLEILASGHYGSKQTYHVAEVANRLIENGGKAPSPSLWSYGAGVRIGRTIGKHFTLKTGVQYLQVRQKVEYREYLWPSANMAPSPIGALALTYRDKVLRSRYNSISVPVLVTYETGKKVKVGVTGGVVINATSSYKGSIPNMAQTDTLIVKDVYKRNTGMAVYAGASISKNVGGVTLFAEPHAILSLSSFTKPGVPFKQKINNYGVSFGIKTSLNFGKKKK